jgi:hypothetical protein
MNASDAQRARELAIAFCSRASAWPENAERAADERLVYRALTAYAILLEPNSDQANDIGYAASEAYGPHTDGEPAGRAAIAAILKLAQTGDVE